MGTKWSERSLIYCTNSRCICWFCWSMLSLSSFNRWIVWIWVKQKETTYWEKMTKLSQRMFTILINNGRTSCCNETISLDNPRLSLNFQLETWNMSIRLKGATMVEMDYRKEKKKSKFCPQCIVNKCMRQHAHGLLGIPPSLNYGIPIIGTFPIINFMISQLSNHVTYIFLIS